MEVPLSINSFVPNDIQFLNTKIAFKLFARTKVWLALMMFAVMYNLVIAIRTTSAYLHVFSCSSHKPIEFSFGFLHTCTCVYVFGFLSYVVA